MTKDLSYLSDEDIQSLMSRYYNGESASKLIKEYKISTSPSNLYKLFPPEVFDNYTCEYCNGPLVADRPSKAMKNAPRYERELYFPVCGHRPYYPSCRCDHCLEQERLLKIEQQRAIEETYSVPQSPVDFSKLSFENKVFLGALCRALLKENLHEVLPFEESKIILAPTNELRKKIYSNLIHEQVLAVSPTSPVEAFDVTDESFPNVFYIYKVTYYLNLSFPPHKQDLFTEILNPNYYSSDYAEDALTLWKEIAIAECIEYLQYQLNKVGFDFSPGDKTHKTFEIILNDFSVSQIYGIIWKSVADASKLYLEKGISKQHAANTVFGACQRYAERAKLNGWDLTQYNRIKNIPQSVCTVRIKNISGIW